jgi:hypothetical protein
MKFQVKRAQQLVVVTPNAIGTSEEIFQRLATAGVDVHCFTANSVGSKGVFMLQCSDGEKAVRALDKSRFDVSVEEVLVLVTKSRLGVAAQVTKRLGVAEVDIEYMYASSHDDQEDSAMVIKCRDNDAAVKALS